MVGIRWISFRRKSEIKALADEFNLDREGTVEELRSHFAACVHRKDHTSAILDRLTTS